MWKTDNVDRDLELFKTEDMRSMRKMFKELNKREEGGDTKVNL